MNRTVDTLVQEFNFKLQPTDSYNVVQSLLACISLIDELYLEE